MADTDPLVGAITPAIHTAFLGASDGVVEGRDVTLRAMHRRGWVTRSSRRNPWRLTLTGWAMRRALEDRSESFALLREAHRVVQMGTIMCHDGVVTMSTPKGPKPGDPCPHCTWLRRHAEWKNKRA